MPLEEYIEKVKQRIERNFDIFDYDWTSITDSVKHCYRNNFSELDAYRFCSYTEEVNPTLTEDKALAKMAVLYKKYGLDDKRVKK